MNATASGPRSEVLPTKMAKASPLRRPSGGGLLGHAASLTFHRTLLAVPRTTLEDGTSGEKEAVIGEG